MHACNAEQRDCIISHKRPRNGSQVCKLRTYVLWEVHHEHLREASAEASPINIDLACLGQIDLLASRAEVLKPAGLERVTEADRQDFLAVTEGTWARTIHSIQILLVHFGEAARCQDETSVDHTVQVGGLLIELKEAFILQIFFVRLLLRQDHAQTSLHLVLCKLLLQPLQIERVHDELRIDLNKELVTLKLAEPFDPSLMLVGHGWII